MKKKKRIIAMSQTEAYFVCVCVCVCGEGASIRDRESKRDRERQERKKKKGSCITFFLRFLSILLYYELNKSRHIFFYLKKKQKSPQVNIR